MSYNRILKAAVLAGTILCSSAVSNGFAQDADKIVAKVDGVVITAADVKLAMQDIGRSLPQQMSAAQKSRYILNYLIDMQLAARKAEQEKYLENTDFKKKMEYFRRKALMEAYIDNLSSKAIDSQKIQATYDDAAKGHKSEVEVNASHILVKTKPEAEAALKRVRGGEDFAKVAKEVSTDPGSPGGKLGWFTKSKMVPPFAEMAFKTKPGTISEPVQSQFGWHIIKVTERRTKEFPKIDQIRGQIRRYLIRKAQSEAIKSLRGSARIEISGASK
jgi:peptidyl-prolyl cis-trans isomerase C